MVQVLPYDNGDLKQFIVAFLSFVLLVLSLPEIEDEFPSLLSLAVVDRKMETTTAEANTIVNNNDDDAQQES